MPKPKLPRQIGKFSALMIGLGSIIGTGAFVSIGIAAGISERYLLISIFFAFLLALCNGISSAQLAANHPVSGGTYEYGRKYINNFFGFISGWVFVFAKCASAAAASLTFGGYLTSALGLKEELLPVLFALIIILLISVILLYGIKKTTLVNNIIVFMSLGALLIFIVLGALTFILMKNDLTTFNTEKVFSNEEIFKNVLYSTAVMFVAFTGYGRIATLGEEVVEPRKNIPKVIFITLFVAFILYSLIALISTKLIGYTQFSTAATREIAPLIAVSEKFIFKSSTWIVAAGAFFAITGVLLNLLLGISRVIFAMGRNGDLPGFLSRVSPKRRTPVYSILASSFIIGIFVFLSDIKTTWSFSAFTVLIYYGITNLAALRLSKKERFYPKSISTIGLFFCFLIAFYIEFDVVKKGLILLAAGIIFFVVKTKTKKHLR
ncbi:MAG: APC family permease [Thermodesulfobacteriota bacterium]